MSQDTDAPADPPAIYLREWRYRAGLCQLAFDCLDARDDQCL
jgi:hypothetical protein